MKNNDKSLELWNKVLKTSLKIHEALINKTSFLLKELSRGVPENKVISAIETNPAKAGIQKSILNEVAI